MSSRLMVWLGAVLIVAGVVSVLLRLVPPGASPQPASATLLVEASNAGLPLSPTDARVSVYAAGTPEHLIGEGEPGQAFVLSPGRYDIRVLFTASADQQSEWLKDVVVTPQSQLVSKLRFSAGELNIEATTGSAQAEAGRVVVFVFKPDQHDNVITSMGAAEPVTLAAGAYDVRAVWSVDAAEKDVRWFRDVKVKSGLQTRLNVLFNRGTLAVEARNADEPLGIGNVSLSVYRAGDEQEELVDSGTAGIPLGLVTGRYDVKATFSGSNDKATRWLRDVEITDAEVAKRSVEFSSGVVVVDAKLSGGEALKPFDVYVYYYRARDHARPVSYTPAGDAVVLEAGLYDVRAMFYRSDDQPDIWLRGINVAAGKSLERTVEFASGRLLVRAYDASGVELTGDNVFVYAYAAGARAHAIATARSGQWLTLAEGTYDLKAIDTRRSDAVRWLPGIVLETGARTEQAVSF